MSINLSDITKYLTTDNPRFCQIYGGCSKCPLRGTGISINNGENIWLCDALDAIKTIISKGEITMKNNNDFKVLMRDDYNNYSKMYGFSTDENHPLDCERVFDFLNDLKKEGFISDEVDFELINDDKTFWI